MRRASRAIILRDGNLLVMHRNKFGKIYDTLPGGELKIGETPEAGVIREIKEETSLDIKHPRLMYLEHAGKMYGDQYVFLCDYDGGEPKILPGAEEDLINKLGKNIHEPKWMPLTELPGSNFVSGGLKKEILYALKNGWPENPKEFT